MTEQLGWHFMPSQGQTTTWCFARGVLKPALLETLRMQLDEDLPLQSRDCTTTVLLLPVHLITVNSISDCVESVPVAEAWSDFQSVSIRDV